MKSVSVVVITYNEEKNIEDCLNSLVSQDYPKGKYEIIVVDASLDKTAELASKFKNVKVHKSKEKGFAAGGALGLNKNDSISIGNSIFYKKVLEDVNGFNPNMKYGGEDTDLTKRLKKKGYKIIIEPDLFVYHKTRNFKEFLSWCFRRGKAKFHLSKSPVQILMPLAILIYPFNSKFWRVVTKRKAIKIDLFSVFLVVPCLFFLRQVFMTLGWSYEFARCFIRKEKY